MRTLLLLTLLTGALLTAESASGVKWKAPAAWKAQAERPMRVATYTVPAAAGDKEAGEMAIFYFGPGQGGGVQANLDRWQAQFPERTTPAVTGKMAVAGLNVTTIDFSGTYAWSASPMSPEKVMKPGYRLIGAIVEAPQGAVFFKLTAPAKTAAANAAVFQTMVKGITKE